MVIQDHFLDRMKILFLLYICKYKETFNNKGSLWDLYFFLFSIVFWLWDFCLE